MNTPGVPDTARTSSNSGSNVNNNVNHTSFEAKALEALWAVFDAGYFTKHYPLDPKVEEINEAFAQLQNLINQDIIGPDVVPNMHPGLLQSNQDAQNRLRKIQRKALGLGISRGGDK